MTPATIIQQAQADGLILRLSKAGTLKAEGQQAALARWLPVLRQHKPQLLAALHAANDTPADAASLARARAAAGKDWPLLESDPALLAAFLSALKDIQTRELGERPAHYTHKAECALCGPVWLWEPLPGVLPGCPWCLNRASGKPIPRPSFSTD
jgi:hypothetical protein